jgi:hypothetical protein
MGELLYGGILRSLSGRLHGRHEEKRGISVANLAFSLEPYKTKEILAPDEPLQNIPNA